MIRFLHLKYFLLYFALFALAHSGLAQTPPEGYYQSAMGKTGGELKTALHYIVNNHTELPYSSSEYDVWDALMETDEDPNNENNVILIYTGRSEAKTHKDDGTGDSDSWNREHIWAKSHGDFGTSPGAGTDIHHIRPCDKSVNADRSNKFFDIGGTAHEEATGCKTDEDSWEPRDEIKGDVARMILYMSVRYEGSNDEPDLEMSNDMGLSTIYDKSPYFGKLSTLIDWHAQDPVDETEQTRHEKIYSIQGNRNPFIDYPEWVETIWVTTDSNSPVISGFSPENGTDDATATQNLIVTFSEEINKGAGNVVIKRDSDDSVFESLDVASARINITNNSVLINPEGQFEENTKYYVLIENSAFTDISSNAFSGITDKTIWSFTTAYTPPLIVEISPVDNSDNVAVDTDLEIVFDKEIQVGNGQIFIYSDGNEIMNMLASVAATCNGEHVTIDLPEDLSADIEYYVIIDEYAFVSTHGAAFAGISSPTEWSFTTETPTSIDNPFAKKAPSFYPNPASTEIQFVNMNDVESLHITNLTGRNIMELKSPGTSISLSHLPKGMYFVTFMLHDGNRVTKKLLKR